jgi:hypothetical protein
LLFYERQKPLGIRAVYHTMVETQGEIGHPADADKIVPIRCGHHLRTLLNLPYAQDRELRLIDNRRAEEPAKYAWIRDRECAACDFVRL